MTSRREAAAPGPGASKDTAQSPADAAADVPPGPASPTALPLTERDRRILDFERQWWRYAGSKERAVRERFALSPTRYYQLLNALLDRPEAMEFDPMLVKRLRRLRASRSRARAARRPVPVTPPEAGSPPVSFDGTGRVGG